MLAQLEKKKYPNLRHVRQGRQLSWTVENIRDGFRKFYDEHGRYPSAYEVDNYEYLPSSRSIQRAFRGLVNLRVELGQPITNYGQGKNRSQIAFRVNKRGKEGENEMQADLIEHFGEYFVHIEKPLDTVHSKERLDFVVYSKGYTFGVDVFNSDNLKTLLINLNHKVKKYQSIKYDVFLVNLNTAVGDDQLARLTHNKRNRLPENIKLVGRGGFLKFIRSLKPISVLE